MSCVFCQIVNRAIPARVIYEDEHSLVFMDIANDVDGHMVAIPKAHCESILDCPQEVLPHFLNAVQKVACHCVEHCGYSGVNLLNASGKTAGQSVPHFHIHIIPRAEGDNIDAWPHFTGAKNPVETVFQRLRMK